MSWNCAESQWPDNGALSRAPEMLKPMRALPPKVGSRKEAEVIAVPLSALLRGLAQQQALRPGSVPDEVWGRAALALL